jgi:hypothetical protein
MRDVRTMAGVCESGEEQNMFVCETTVVKLQVTILKKCYLLKCNQDSSSSLSLISLLFIIIFYECLKIIKTRGIVKQLAREVTKHSLDEN